MWRRGADTGAPPGVASSPAEPPGPVSIADLQRLEQLAFSVDSEAAEEEEFVEAKLALLSRPTPADMVGPVPHLTLPTDELSALERLRASERLSDSEYETLRRRVLLRI